MANRKGSFGVIGSSQQGLAKRLKYVPSDRKHKFYCFSVIAFTRAAPVLLRSYRREFDIFRVRRVRTGASQIAISQKSFVS
ncbi:MAG: hypothetical protein DME38_11590 [Verrucomicrobia bacterium]|nr:MAG: hypothetical protein DME38_11590 [Verrucomicrobiota bacterium]